MRGPRLELGRVAPRDPKSRASTDSAIRAVSSSVEQPSCEAPWGRLLLWHTTTPTCRRIWMEPHHYVATAANPQEVVAKVDQKALRLSALLREIDNHPIELDAVLRDQLD